MLFMYVYPSVTVTRYTAIAITAATIISVIIHLNEWHNKRE